MSDNTLDATIAELKDSLTWPENWNTYNALAPNPVSVSSAQQWITEFYQHITSTNQQWIKPNITASGNGEMVFGWRRGQRKLNVYVDEASIDYIQAWGNNINTEMTDGDIETIDDMQRLWQWLLEANNE